MYSSFILHAFRLDDKIHSNYNTQKQLIYYTLTLTLNDR